jgi:hypothetical protein
MSTMWNIGRSLGGAGHAPVARPMIGLYRLVEEDMDDEEMAIGLAGRHV